MTIENNQPLLSWEDCKWRLGKLWITSAAVFFGMVLFLSLTGRFDIEGAHADLAKAFPKPVETAVKWALNAVLPSISLIIGALLSNLGAPPRQESSQVVEARQFRLAYGVSLFYLAILFVILLASLSVNKLPVEVLDASSIWIGPCQGISGTILSVFYVRAALAAPASASPSK
ncbi:MAG: hypothetical protein ACO1TE_11585 [Prosthecobacter sp.]